MIDAKNVFAEVCEISRVAIFLAHLGYKNGFSKQPVFSGISNMSTKLPAPGTEPHNTETDSDPPRNVPLHP